jgi:hypothetical protein
MVKTPHDPLRAIAAEGLAMAGRVRVEAGAKKTKQNEA